MNVVFMTYFEYPGENACANRLNKLARSLIAAKHVVRIVSVSYQETSSHILCGHDVDGVEFIKICNRHRSWDFSRCFMLVNDACSLYRSLVAINSKDRVDLVLGYGEQSIRYFFVRRFCTGKNLPFIADLTEWLPFDFRRFLSVQYLDHLFFRVGVLSRITGAVGISSYLFEQCKKRNVPAIIVPSLCAEGTNSANSSAKRLGFAIGYIGQLFHRDDPIPMLEAVEGCLRKWPELKFHIIGKIHHRVSMPEAVNKLAIMESEQVVVTGFVPREEYENLLDTMDIFILLRTRGVLSEASFPTRLPEILSKGKPVIISDVGDVSRYLTHNKDAYIVPSGNHSDSIAEGICRLRCDDGLYGSIANGALAAASKKFYYMNYCQLLHRFIVGLHRVKNEEKNASIRNTTGSKTFCA